MFLSFLSPSTADRLVNKRQLATRLGVSLVTLDNWLLKWADEFPVEEKGTNGREYRFDPVRVGAFLTAKQAEQEQSRAEKDAALSQYVLPMDLGGVTTASGNGGVLSIKDRKEALLLQQLQRKEAQESGRLVVAEDVANLLFDTLAKLSRNEHQAIRRICKDHGIPDAVMRSLLREFAVSQREFVRDTTRGFQSSPHTASAMEDLADVLPDTDDAEASYV
ncbi:Hypothetical protein GbCGDNIH3_7068 [Granulibacter bethesdensis]|uniref:Uncharacterized protein n=1 Tax=Granulibacter bethesdensis TaxID=364410 RepID=A0AAN0RE53_9PROT|nr:terminase small subunit [Granulibacter bethesdensis]AHJ63240.1 Hypothetical protein GbCGDNIH3_7068 [Granulibacter bethesdensis]